MQLDRGRHTVEFRFAPAWMSVGAGISLFTALGLLTTLPEAVDLEWPADRTRRPAEPENCWPTLVTGEPLD